MKDVILIVASVAVIFLSIALMELVFQRRLVEILDRFLARSMSDLAASQFVSGKREPIEQSLDLETELDLNAIRDIQNSLFTPIEAGRTEED